MKRLIFEKSVVGALSQAEYLVVEAGASQNMARNGGGLTSRDNERTGDFAVQASAFFFFFFSQLTHKNLDGFTWPFL
jgi:hypothetical protein